MISGKHIRDVFFIHYHKKIFFYYASILTSNNMCYILGKQTGNMFFDEVIKSSKVYTIIVNIHMDNLVKQLHYIIMNEVK